ncbi:uncharacterized protein K452DRAFT_18772 [Aplosporella prunicola CBS 121167]|uniref:Uncharacterized protein n=1 Tax=Aplosporella prunicola CBS 121167 TaxID=1176127 RepID=A0A6A6BIP4_9PEZI|nr:uncharacterized protein K452DRAFT_18772 [Aplosporella prunicola CBS 121167]KAF2142441.1 hypothetical protein K452DRAFT_18772 [Aplosporella prunicola CBS 121167]
MTNGHNPRRRDSTAVRTRLAYVPTLPGQAGGLAGREFVPGVRLMLLLMLGLGRGAWSVCLFVGLRTDGSCWVDLSVGFGVGSWWCGCVCVYVCVCICAFDLRTLCARCDACLLGPAWLAVDTAYVRGRRRASRCVCVCAWR